MRVFVIILLSCLIVGSAVAQKPGISTPQAKSLIHDSLVALKRVDSADVADSCSGGAARATHSLVADSAGTSGSTSTNLTNTTINGYMRINGDMIINGHTREVGWGRRLDTTYIQCPRPDTILALGMEAASMCIGTPCDSGVSAGRGTGTVHPAIVYVPGGYWGWNRFLLYTGDGALTEHPMLRVSNDGVDWHRFSRNDSVLRDPIWTISDIRRHSAHPSWALSDVDLLLGPDGKMWMFGRVGDTACITGDCNNIYSAIWASSSSDLLNWDSPKIIIPWKLEQGDTTLYMSPATWADTNGTFKMWLLNIPLQLLIYQSQWGDSGWSLMDTVRTENAFETYRVTPTAAGMGTGSYVFRDSLNQCVITVTIADMGETGNALVVDSFVQKINASADSGYVTAIDSGDYYLIVADTTAGGQRLNFYINTDTGQTVTENLLPWPTGDHAYPNVFGRHMDIIDNGPGEKIVIGNGISTTWDLYLGVVHNGGRTLYVRGQPILTGTAVDYQWDKYLYRSSGFMVNGVHGQEIELYVGGLISAGNGGAGIARTFVTFEKPASVSAQTITKTEIDSTASNIVFDNAYEGTSAVADSQYATHHWAKSQFDNSTIDTASGLYRVKPQSLTKTQIDSTSSNVVFDGAFEGKSSVADSQYATMDYVRTGGKKSEGIFANVVFTRRNGGTSLIKPPFTRNDTLWLCNDSSASTSAAQYDTVTFGGNVPYAFDCDSAQVFYHTHVAGANNYSYVAGYKTLYPADSIGTLANTVSAWSAESTLVSTGLASSNVPFTRHLAAGASWAVAVKFHFHYAVAGARWVDIQRVILWGKRGNW
jgi:hypothetical protein